jgi:hypothetical protein
MRTTIIALAVTLLAFTGQAFSQATKFPQRGFQFRCERHINYHGWQCDGGGFYEKKDVPAGTVITPHNMENWMECCVNTFSPYKKVGSNKVMLVRTKPVTRDADGGVVSEEVIDWILVEKKPHENYWEDCELNGHKFLLSVVDEKRKTLVGFQVNETGFRQMSLNWRSFPCNIP